MLIRFIVDNYLSFKEETEFNMFTTNDQKWHKHHLYKYKDLDIVKTAAIYGANGAGKSNFIKAISLLQDIVVDGGQHLSKIKKFKGQQNIKNHPTQFEIEFTKEGTPYAYGLSIDNNIILSEWLVVSGLGKKEDENIFSRTSERGNITINFSEKYTQTEEDKFRVKFYQDEFLKENQVLLKELATLKDTFKEVKEVFQWFKNDLTIIFPGSKPEAILAHMTKSAGFKKFADSLICSFHTGIHEMGIKKYKAEDFFGKDDYKVIDEIKETLEQTTSKMVSVKSHVKFGVHDELIAEMENDELVIKRLINKHKNREGKTIDFFRDEESEGTNRLLDLIPAMYQILVSDSTVIIDEIDQSIHPALLKELISKVVSNEETKGQLIFTTHESNLLDQEIFRRDEIWFVEKDYDETKIYPLSDYDIRADLDIRKGYLNGRFGAIPFIGNLKDLNWNAHVEAE